MPRANATRVAAVRPTDDAAPLGSMPGGCRSPRTISSPRSMYGRTFSPLAPTRTWLTQRSRSLEARTSRPRTSRSRSTITTRTTTSRTTWPCTSSSRSRELPASFSSRRTSVLIRLRFSGLCVTLRIWFSLPSFHRLRCNPLLRIRLALAIRRSQLAGTLGPPRPLTVSVSNGARLESSDNLLGLMSSMVASCL